MHKEGAIILGIGGDNSDGAQGTFYEGVMTSGYPSDATENAVQANIVAAGYATTSITSGPARHRGLVGLAAGHDGLLHHPVHRALGHHAWPPRWSRSSSSSTLKAQATWIVRAGLANSSCVSFESKDTSGSYLRHSGFQLYLNANDGSTLFAQDATFCPQTGASGTGQLVRLLQLPDPRHPSLQQQRVRRQQRRSAHVRRLAPLVRRRELGGHHRLVLLTHN